MKNYSIGVFDSGIGGLSTLFEIRNLLPNEDYVYYADRKNNPYGNKSKDELISLVDNVVKYFIRNKVKLIVVACNTATTNTIKIMKERYPDIIFVGTVPAVKVACDNDFKNILVISTVATYNSSRLQEIIHDNKKEGVVIELLPCVSLAKIIEHGTNKEINDELLKLLPQYSYADAIVLGSTHYSIVKDTISKILPNTKIIDGNIGVSKEVKRQLENNSLLNDKKSNGSIKIKITLGGN